MLRSTVRSNVKPKCGNKSFLTLHVFLGSYGSLFSAKFCYSLRTGQRSDATLLIANVLNSTKSRQIDLSIYPDKALRRRIRLVTA